MQDPEFKKNTLQDFPALSVLVDPHIRVLKDLGFKEVEKNEDKVINKPAPVTNASTYQGLSDQVEKAEDNEKFIDELLSEVSSPSSLQEIEDAVEAEIEIEQEFVEEVEREVTEVERQLHIEEDNALDGVLQELQQEESRSIVDASPRTTSRKEEPVTAAPQPEGKSEAINELEKRVVSELDKLTESELRYKLAQLNMEMIERIKWESYRIHEAIKQAEEKSFSKYEVLLAQQRGDLELLSERRLQDKEATLKEQYQVELDRIKEIYEEKLKAFILEHGEKVSISIRNEVDRAVGDLRSQLDLEFNLSMAQLRDSHTKQMLKAQDDITAANATIAAINQAIDDRLKSLEYSDKVHRQAAAIMALQETMKESIPLKDQINELQACANDDPLVVYALKSLPEQASKQGVYTLQQLLDRFQVVKEEVRKSSLSPVEAPKIVGQIVGTVLAKMTVEPSGYVNGESIEAVMARASFFFEKGDIENGLRELDTIEGSARVLLQDWIKLARDRWTVDLIADVLKANAITRHRQMTNV